MSAQSPRPQPIDSDGVSRRGFFKRAAIAGGAVVTVGAGGSAIAPRISPIGRAEAGAWKAFAAGVAGPIGWGWALREYEIVGSNPPPEGLTPGALEEDIYQTSRTRWSTNKSTFIDNGNILTGAEHAAYANGKVAAIEVLNNQLTQQEVTDAGIAAVTDHETTVKTNFLKTWNESVSELQNMIQSVRDMSELSVTSVFNGSKTVYVQSNQNVYSNTQDITFSTRSITLPSDESFELKQIKITETEYSNSMSYDPLQENLGSYPERWQNKSITPQASEPFDYLAFNEWNAIWTEIDSVFTNAQNGIITWVDGIYGDIQSGELDTADLLTPAELAELSADSGINKAMADLMALNIPVDLEREATISMESDNGTMTISGALAPTDPPSDGIVSGETYDPANMTGDVYFNYDISQASAVWTAYEAAVDGGIVTFTSDPHTETLFRITTTAGEQVTVSDSDFTEDDSVSPSVWTTDISGKVDNVITEITEVEMTTETGDAQYEMIQLDRPFTVEKIENSDGEEQDSMTFTQSEPQDDTNYITQEEWDAMKKRNQELIDKYEESQEDDDDGPGPIFGGGDWLEGGGGLLGLGIIGVVILAVIGIVTDAIPGLGN